MGTGRLGGRSIVTTLIFVNVAVFMLPSLFPSLENLIYGFGAMQAGAVIHGQLWRLITAQYLHGGFGHLFINMLVLHFLGRSLERMWSPRKFFAIYTMCGLAGNIFFTFLGAQGIIDIRMPAVGASGCIYGLLGIVAVLFPAATVYVYFLFPIKIRTAAFIFGGIALFSIIKRGDNYGGEACHLAGLVFGVWWAMKGDAWWATTRWRLPSMRRRSKQARPRGFAKKVAQRREDQETIDKILRKVYDGGIHSLSDRERQALQDATERQRIREQEAGRIDRL
jgi:membrane associated rhomboid family serine protease